MEDENMKTAILTAHKDTYYTAAALLLKAVKEADILFTSADTFHNDLIALKTSNYEKIYVIGIRFREDYKQEIKDAISAVLEAKKKIKIYTIEDRFEIKGAEAKFFYTMLTTSEEGKEGKKLIDYINSIEKPPEPDFIRLKDLYDLFEAQELKKTCKKSEEICDIAEYVQYSINMYWKWQR
jgi:1,2-phenylacetyl-CoA epoxidase PaaB subunit